jgi:hypothetical protein
MTTLGHGCLDHVAGGAIFNQELWSHVAPDPTMNSSAFDNVLAGNGSVLDDYYSKEGVADAIMAVTLLANAIVTNADNHSKPAIEVLDDINFLILYRPKNRGAVIVHGAAGSKVYVISPTNYADAEPILVTGAGSFAVAGGSNAGDIEVHTSGSVSVGQLDNSGSVNITTSPDVTVSDVVNSGNINVRNITATLINVVNHGSVNVKGGGSYFLYDSVNNGTITVEAGTIHAELGCPGNTNGVVTLADAVTGTIEAECGCEGTITHGTGVALTVVGECSPDDDDDDDASTGTEEASSAKKLLSSALNFTETPTDEELASVADSFCENTAAQIEGISAKDIVCVTVKAPTKELAVTKVTLAADLSEEKQTIVTESMCTAYAGKAGVDLSSLKCTLQASSRRRFRRRLLEDAQWTLRVEATTDEAASTARSVEVKLDEVADAFIAEVAKADDTFVIAKPAIEKVEKFTFTVNVVAADDATITATISAADVAKVQDAVIEDLPDDLEVTVDVVVEQEVVPPSPAKSTDNPDDFSSAPRRFGPSSLYLVTLLVASAAFLA